MIGPSLRIGKLRKPLTAIRGFSLVRLEVWPRHREKNPSADSRPLAPVPCNGENSGKPLDSVRDVVSRSSLQNLSILLVESSLPQSRIIVDRLQQVGIHQVEVANNGQQALDAMRANLPDLVLSAMYFEDMSGPELIKAIRTDNRLADVPFILVSGERHAHNLEPMRQAGILAILPKPFAVADLKTALYASLDYIEPERLELTDPDMDNLRVLVVDDSEFAAKHIVHLLQRMGFKDIQVASNGRTAAEAIRDQYFSLVITDYHMPEMDGEQLVNYIRHLSEQPNVPILMITAEQDSARLASVRQAGVSALLDKPFDVTTIKGILQRLLRAESQASV